MVAGKRWSPLRADRVAQIGEIPDNQRCSARMRRLFGVYPEYKALQGRNRES